MPGPGTRAPPPRPCRTCAGARRARRSVRAPPAAARGRARAVRGSRAPRPRARWPRRSARTPAPRAPRRRVDLARRPELGGRGPEGVGRAVLGGERRSADEARSSSRPAWSSLAASSLSSSVSPGRGDAVSISRTWYASRSIWRSRSRSRSSSSARAAFASRRRPCSTRRASTASRCSPPAYRSRNRVWATVDSSRWPSCWPCTSTSSPASSASADTGASCPLDPRGAPALGGHGPREQDLAVLGPPGARRRRRGIEPRLHLRGRRARPNERRAAAPAERELQPDRHHRLAGPGLAGEDVQARMQLEVEVLDHAETADVELAEHAPILDRSADVPGEVAGEVELVADQVVERRGVLAADEPRRRRGAPDLGPWSRSGARGCADRPPSAARAPGRAPRGGRAGRPRAPASGRTPCARRSASPRCDGTEGDTIGPPALNEYAVEPVGVAEITPSAENVVT